jgi:tRNA(fMet)-specific endonuclease VapC
VAIAAERGARGALDAAEELALSVVTVSELLQGAERGLPTRRAFVEQLLDTVEPIDVTEPVARVHARLWAELATAGQTLGVHDSWIAATALTHGLGVLTRDAAFHRVPGLRVVSP